MTKPDLHSETNQLDRCSIQERQQIEELCDQFEAQWKREGAPDLSKFAQRLPEDLRAFGLRELIILEMHYRQQAASTLTGDETDVAGEPAPSWQDYVRRFPELRNVAAPAASEADAPQAPLDDRFQRDRFYAAGGLGRVSIARDLQFGRQVAIKEMRQSLADQPTLRRRFLREARITGSLEHPCIVPVYARGSDERGAPYYAMRLIEGPTLLDAIVGWHQSDPPDEVEFRGLVTRLIEICRAVAYAHEQGVIHRDIKPQNIIVGDYGETLLIDWGLACRFGESDPHPSHTESPETADAWQTQAGAVMGTPPYMSPEQSCSSQVEPASDIYSLGASLYHLVHGQPPSKGRSDTEELGRIPLVLKRPLLAISDLAMQEDPQRRYRSAKELADDLERALADQPIRAATEHWPTRLRRWSKRHRSLTTAAGVAGLLLVASLSGYAWLTHRHADQLSQKNDQLDQAVQQESRARRDAEDSEKLTNDAMNYWINALRSPDPDRDGREIKVVEILDQATSRLEADFVDQPLAHARMAGTLARTYHGLGLPDKALPLAEVAHQMLLTELGPDDLRTLDAAFRLAEICASLNDPRAEDLMSEAVAGNLERRGPRHPDTLVVLSANAMFQARRGGQQQAIETLLELQPEFEEVFGPESKRMYSFKNDLANVYHLGGDFRKAIQISRNVYQRRRETLGDDALTTITNGSNYVVHLLNSPQRSEAVPVLEHLLAVARSSLGDDHPQTLISMNRLGDCYGRMNRRQEAIALIEEALQRRRDLYGDDHPATLVSANSLGTLYLNTGQYQKAADQLKQVYDASVEVRGADNSDTLTLGNNLASAYRLLGNNTQAIELFKITLDAQQRTLGKEHLYAIRTMINLSSVLLQDEQLEEAQSVILETCDLAEANLGAEHPLTQTAWSVAGSIHLGLEQFDSARQFFQRCYDSRLNTMPDHWLLFHTQSQLGEAIMRLGDLEQAEPLLLAGYEGMQQRENTMVARARHRLEDGRNRLIQLYQQTDRPDQAQALRDQAQAPASAATDQ